jgi:hypothetical protein
MKKRYKSRNFLILKRLQSNYNIPDITRRKISVTIYKVITNVNLRELC